MFKVVAENPCMFSGTTSCSKEFLNMTHIVCKKHAKDIFNLSSTKHNLFTGKTEIKNVINSTFDSGCSDEIPLLPFPFDLTQRGGANRQNVNPFFFRGSELCINTDDIRNSISGYISTRNLPAKGYSQVNIQNVTHSLITYISGGSYQASISIFDTGVSQNYQQFVAQNEVRLNSYWGDDDNILIGVALRNNNIQPYPIRRLPIFYKAMLVNFEVSEHTYINGNPRRLIVSNCIFNCSTKMLHTFPQGEDNVIYKDLPGTTFATPLVLVGSAHHTNQIPYRPFEKPEVFPSYYAQVSRPTPCN